MNFQPFRTLLWVGTFCLVCIAGVSRAAEPEVPDTFLPAPGKLREVLQIPVSGSFRATSAPEVIAALCQQLPANNSYKGDPRAASTFTGTFKNTPLRTALFRVAQATHITIEWARRPDGSPWFIIAHE